MAQQLEPITRMVSQLARLPGIGQKSAQRLAYHIIGMPLEDVRELASALYQGRKAIRYCAVCGNYATGELCDICADERRRKVDDKRKNHQYRRYRKRDVEFTALFCINVKCDCQRGSRTCKSLEKPVYDVRNARREKQRRGLAEDSSDGKDTACYNTVDTARQNNRSDNSPFARAQPESAFTVTLRDGFQAFLRGSHNRGQVHYNKRQRARDY